MRLAMLKSKTVGKLHQTPKHCTRQARPLPLRVNTHGALSKYLQNTITYSGSRPLSVHQWCLIVWQQVQSSVPCIGWQFLDLIAEEPYHQFPAGGEQHKISIKIEKLLEHLVILANEMLLDFGELLVWFPCQIKAQHITVEYRYLELGREMKICST